LELAFESKSLRNTCEVEAQAVLELGSLVAESLKHRLADLRAAASVRDLVAGRPRVAGGEDRRRMVVDLCDGFCLVFRSNHTKNPLIGADDIDWSKVTRIRVLGIERRHGY
jgi:proteic killer suppression protein